MATCTVDERGRDEKEGRPYTFGGSRRMTPAGGAIARPCTVTTLPGICLTAQAPELAPETCQG